MNKLSFESYAKFNEYLNSTEGKVESSKIIVKEIYDGLKSKKTRLKVLTVDLEQEDMKFSVNIARNYWGDALASCLKNFEEHEKSDECIDTYMVIQKFNELK